MIFFHLSFQKFYKFRTKNNAANIYYIDASSPLRDEASRFDFLDEAFCSRFLEPWIPPGGGRGHREPLS